METITGEKFEELLKEQLQIFNKIIEFDNDFILDIRSFQKFQITDCKFINKALKIKDSSTSNSEQRFDILNNKVIDIENCEFLYLEITQYNDDLFLKNNIFHNFKISNCTLFDFIFSSNTIKKEFVIHTSRIIKDTLLYGNIFNDKSELSIIESKFNNKIAIGESNLHNLYLYDSEFDSLKFNDNTVNTNSFFNIANCVFVKSSFSDSDFARYTILDNCTFTETAVFVKNGNLIHTEFQFRDCKFEKSLHFNQSAIREIKIYNCFFKDIASFQNSYFLQISIDKTIFDKLVLFDDLNIGNINQCDRKTLRNIKQQLQKADNKIDYNRFRNYELNAYYQELGWGWKSGFKDKFILFATKISTGFDHSWRRALGFTLGFGLLFYSFFFISVNHHLEWDLSNWREYGTGYFRFLIVTDFYSPLTNGREYISNTNFLGWIVFILGKIFIAFGIYEMIQAFRKFKA